MVTTSFDAAQPMDLPQSLAKRWRWDYTMIAACMGLLAYCGVRMAHIDEVRRPPEVTYENGLITCRLGDVPPGKKITRTVAIKNPTDRELRVAELYKSCGCFEATCTTIIPPGGEGQLTAKDVPVPESKGNFSYEITVFFDRKDVSPQRVRITGRVGAWISMIDPPVAACPKVCAGQSSRQTVTLYTEESWHEPERSIECLFPFARLVSAREEDEARRIVCEVEFASPRGTAVGRYMGRLKVSWRGHEERVYSVPCQGRVVPEWATETKSVFLGKLRADAETPFSFRAWNRRTPVLPEAAAYRAACDVPYAMRLETKIEENKLLVSGVIVANHGRRTGVVCGVVSVTAPSGEVCFRVPIYWEWE